MGIGLLAFFYAIMAGSSWPMFFGLLLDTGLQVKLVCAWFLRCAAVNKKHSEIERDGVGWVLSLQSVLIYFTWKFHEELKKAMSPYSALYEVA